MNYGDSVDDLTTEQIIQAIDDYGTFLDLKRIAQVAFDKYMEIKK